MHRVGLWVKVKRLPASDSYDEGKRLAFAGVSENASSTVLQKAVELCKCDGNRLKSWNKSSWRTCPAACASSCASSIAAASAKLIQCLTSASLRAIYMCVCLCVLHCDITIYYYYVIFCDICDHPVGSSNWITLNHLESRWCPKIDTSDWMVRTTNFQVDGDAATWPKDLAELDISWYQMILNDVNRLSLDMGNTYLGHDEYEN